MDKVHSKHIIGLRRYLLSFVPFFIKYMNLTTEKNQIMCFTD